MTGPERAPLTWRIPPWQPVLLFLVAAGCAAGNIYTQPSVTVRVVTIAVGALALTMAIAATRMYFVVDYEGVGVRRLLRERSLDWADIADVSVVEQGLDRLTVRVTSHDGRYLDVPQSLLMPAKPSPKPRVRAQLGDIARQVRRYGEPYQR
ncbi:MAG TPA: PH domain-containing protein [Jatrophihabitans sp.]|nr:PH domain-containing protein [Jatrophihabitans sp.]